MPYTADQNLRPQRATFIEKALAAGEALLFTDFPNAQPCAISMHPAPGATVYVSLSTSIPARIADGSYRLTACGVGVPGTAPDGAPAGVVSGIPDGLTLDAPVAALRFHCVGGPAAVEIVQ